MGEGPLAKRAPLLSLLLLEHLWVGRRPLIGPAEAIPATVGERQQDGDHRGEAAHLDLQHLAFLELIDQLGRRFIVCRACIGEAAKEGATDRRLLVDDDAGTS